MYDTYTRRTTVLAAEATTVVLSPFQCHGVHDVANDARPGIVAGFDSPDVARYRSVTKLWWGGSCLKSRLPTGDDAKVEEKGCTNARLLQAFVALLKKTMCSKRDRAEQIIRFTLTSLLLYKSLFFTSRVVRGVVVLLPSLDSQFHRLELSKTLSKLGTYS